MICPSEHLKKSAELHQKKYKQMCLRKFIPADPGALTGVESVDERSLFPLLAYEKYTN